MSTPIARKPAANPANTPPRRPPNENTPSRPPVASAVPATTGQGLARTPSLRQTRLARKPTNRMSNSFASPESEPDNEETKAANAQLIADLKEQVHRAEQASDQYRKQLEVMQKRLDDAAGEQTTSEERDYQRQTEIDRLRVEYKDSIRQYRELEIAYDADKNTFLHERERQVNKEADLEAKISRLTATLRARDADRVSASRSGAAQKDDVDNSTLDAPAPDYSEALQQKDVAIENLRLDLAEAQLKLAEQEHVGDGRVQSLEKALMELKMHSARLLEENESFQMLLSEKTLKGDFLHDNGAHMSGMSTLAEELESSGELTEGQSDAVKRLDVENRSLRDQNKALALYVDKIIGRLLQHDGFEHIIHDKDDPPKPPAKTAPVEKALPATPDQQALPGAASVSGVANGLLQRARSVVSRPGGKARPMSYAQPSPPAPTANENPDTAPSIPIGRGHRRARSDQAQADMAVPGAAAAVVHQMNRASTMRTVSSGPLSPGIRPLSPQLSQNRQSYFGGSSNRATSASGQQGGSSANSITSEHSDEQRSGTDGSSTAPASSQGQGNIPGAVMKQNHLRPLRLVQEQVATEEDERKRANRGSWMGWLRGGTLEAQND
ncbi:uncharacterized protein A1O9_04479 [Exophiala aquamarina CBS 119918]|uniref:M protein, serotype 2.1 n=1 Tax=Exophiala aquamarina CBS 119918 TaxID=1182545 RepID=A0A072PJY0_9EURO|nr:uncharacterized protein A1O9_04479 [Exophiala aquamarina CBS 119918]KEF59633.1 hypothetical protein A1O9_04479 [Exophiala aquamarina CBS 119918]